MDSNATNTYKFASEIKIFRKYGIFRVCMTSNLRLYSLKNKRERIERVNFNLETKCTSNYEHYRNKQITILVSEF